jgi:ABC-type ATPase with predicted acetyltransferase domain
VIEQSSVRRTHTFTVSKSFETRVQKDPRVLEVAESFGLGLSDKKFTIYNDITIEIRPGDVVYIHGQSGSGKSLLLRDLADKLGSATETTANIDDVTLRDVPLVAQIGRDTAEALALMNQAGLNDAYLWVRTPKELSDGQRYRFRLAKLIEGGANVWIADEFGAVLDRETAKIVAFNISKAARAAGATLIVATTHDDLVDYLAPTLSVQKLFGDRVEVSRAKWQLVEE